MLTAIAQHALHGVFARHVDRSAPADRGAGSPGPHIRSCCTADGVDHPRMPHSLVFAGEPAGKVAAMSTHGTNPSAAAAGSGVHVPWLQLQRCPELNPLIYHP